VKLGFLILLITGVFLISLVSGCASAPQSPAVPASTSAVPAISAQDAFNLIQTNKDNPKFVIMDVRTAAEFNSGHLANSTNLDYYSPDFKSNLDKLSRNEEYLVYCQTGVRGAAAARLMTDLGFTKVHNLTGGIVDWINAGYPTVK